MADLSIHASLIDAANTEARYRDLFAALHEPILTTSADGRVTGFNRAALDLFGGAARLYGRPIQDLLPLVAIGEDGDGKSTWEGPLEDATGRTLVVEVSRTRLDDGRVPIGDVYVVHDISRHAELNRLREQLLYSVAHELRGPLAVLGNTLDILATEYGDLSTSEFDRLVSSARRTAVGLHDLMEELLSAGTIQSGRFHVSPQPVDLALIVDDALEAVQPVLDAREQHIERDLAEVTSHVLADRRYARQVLTSLVRNASTYSPQGEVIRIRAEQADDHVRVTVEDRGPGIADEQRAGLFERFYRVRPGYDEPGIGLGLAIAKGIIEAHGGSIGVESQVDVGTRVWFTLPAAREREV